MNLYIIKIQTVNIIDESLAKQLLNQYLVDRNNVIDNFILNVSILYFNSEQEVDSAITMFEYMKSISGISNIFIFKEEQIED